MRIRALLKYFYFIARHWNLRLALFTIWYEINGDKKYAIDTIGIDHLHNVKVKGVNLEHAYIYQPASYYLLKKSFDFLNEHIDKKGFVDFGCGKGRVLAVAADSGFERVTGVEFAEELCAVARKNTNKIAQQYPSCQLLVKCIDAIQYEVQKTDNVFFFFNPFDDKIMLEVLKNILASQKQFPREITVVYINPLFKEIFLAASFEEVYSHTRLEYLEVSILIKIPEKKSTK